MKPEKFKELQSVCQMMVRIKKQLIEELPHSGHESLYFQNNEITTGLLNNKIEIKIHLQLNKLLFFDNEKSHYIDLNDPEISEKLKDIVSKYDLKLPDEKLQPVDSSQSEWYNSYASKALEILELYRMTLNGNFTLVHLWPHNFDFSIEWFTGNKDEKIGTGITPGDEQYDEPYLYMNPWPFNEKIIEKPLPIGKWHTDTWSGIKVELNDLLTKSPIDAAENLHQLFEISKVGFELMV